VNNPDFKAVLKLPRNSRPTVVDKEKREVTWVAPQLVCIVEFMTKSKTGGMRQPVFKSLRYDKIPEECTTK